MRLKTCEDLWFLVEKCHSLGLHLFDFLDEMGGSGSHYLMPYGVLRGCGLIDVQSNLLVPVGR